MSVRYILLLMLFHESFPYYFYNPSTHQILSLPSLRSRPQGYKLIPPPSSHRKGMFKKDRNQESHCSESGFRCNTPYARTETYQFECEHDSQCPSFFKCCPQTCFQHKICVRAKSLSGELMNPYSKHKRLRQQDNTRDPENHGSCEIYNFQCSSPFPYTSTAMFRCVSDKQCPENFKCCQQRCFAHKICSRSIPGSSEPYMMELRKKAEDELVSITTEDGDANDEIVETTTETKTTETDMTEADSTTETKTTEVDSTTESETTEVDSTTESETSTVTETITENETTTIDIETSTGEEITTIGEAATETVTSSDVQTETTISKMNKDDINDVDDEKEVTSDDPEEIEELVATTMESKVGETPDPNAIVPEYSEYYYDYGTRNETEDYES